jgi:hypothetical protein
MTLSTLVGDVALDASRPSILRGAALELARSLRSHGIFIALVAGHAAAAYLAPLVVDIGMPFSIDRYSGISAVLTATLLCVLGAAYVVYVMAVVRPERLARHLWSDVTGRFLTSRRICMALPAFMLLPLLMASFSYMKRLIPVFHPFDWDPALADWDRLLHGGRHPWEWLQPLLGHPYLSFAVNVVYNFWFFALFGVMFWQTFSVARPLLRMRYLLTLSLIWILLGNLAATLMASAGPVYYARITGLADPFAPLIDYLHAANEVVPLWALAAQDYLWEAQFETTFAIGSGLSAMPSIHLATTFSFALLGFAVRRWLGIAFTVMTVMILIGSVHLGWHYAIDGYAAIAATWLIWAAVGWLLDQPAVAGLLWGRSEPAAETSA